MKRVIASVILTLVFPILAFAHGNEKHVMGTVTRISGNTVTVQTVAKQSVSVDVSDKTKFEKSGAAATLADLKVGDKVVIHAAQEKGKLVATEVKFGTHSMEGMKGMKGMKGMDHKQGATTPPDHQ